MDVEFLKTIAHQISLVPPLPEVAQKLLQLTDEPDKVNMQEVVKIISTDQAIAMKLLNIANSPFYGYQKNVTKITQAVFIVGLDVIKSLAISIAVAGHSRNDNVYSLLKKQDFWLHALSTGILSRNLASYFTSKNAEEAFIAGLIHDIGKIIFLEYSTDLYHKVLTEAGKEKETIHFLEEEIFEIAHAELGAELCRHWKIPASIIDAVEQHHLPIILGQPINKLTLPEILNISNDLSRIIGLGDGGNKLVSLDSINYLLKSHVTFDSLKTLIKISIEEAECLSQYFGMSINSYPEENNKKRVLINLKNPEETFLLSLIFLRKNYELVYRHEGSFSIENLVGIIHDDGFSQTQEEAYRNMSVKIINFEEWKEKNIVNKKSFYPVEKIRNLI